VDAGAYARRGSGARLGKRWSNDGDAGKCSTVWGKAWTCVESRGELGKGQGKVGQTVEMWGEAGKGRIRWSGSGEVGRGVGRLSKAGGISYFFDAYMKEQ
jgi:hypothetical protein